MGQRRFSAFVWLSTCAFPACLGWFPARRLCIGMGIKNTFGLIACVGHTWLPLVRRASVFSDGSPNSLAKCHANWAKIYMYVCTYKMGAWKHSLTQWFITRDWRDCHFAALFQAAPTVSPVPLFFYRVSYKWALYFNYIAELPNNLTFETCRGIPAGLLNFCVTKQKSAHLIETHWNAKICSAGKPLTNKNKAMPQQWM